MEINIDRRAARWFEEEVGLPQGCGIRFIIRLYGSSEIQKGYALGFEPNIPDMSVATKLVTDKGLVLYVEEDDLWFFDGHDLYIDYNEELQEPIYRYQKPS